MKVLGVHIAHGFSSEARVFAEWLGQRADQYEALVLHHAWDGDEAAAMSFQATSRADVRTIDTGWRPNPDNSRSFWAKIGSHARFQIALPEMLRAARAYNPDVIFSNQQKWDCHASSFLARMLKRPQTLLLCYPIGDYLGSEVVNRITQCDQLVVIDEYARQDALRHGVPADRVTKVLPSITPSQRAEKAEGQAVRRELGIPLDAQLIGIVARLDPQKGQRDVIRAFARIADRFPSAHLLIVGDSTTGETPRELLEQEALKTGFGYRITFDGWRRDLPRVLAALDVFIHPSRWDTISLAPLEASAAALPVVAYAESGALEAVQDGITGLLAPPGDLDGLAECLAQLLQDPAKASAMGEAGRAFVRSSFDPPTLGRAFADVLRSADNGGSSERAPVTWLPGRGAMAD